MFALTGEYNSMNGMFIRMTATKWRLTDDMRHQIGALLVYMRNEFRAGVSAVSYDTPNQQSSAIEGSAINYKRMMQCIDRILTRLDGNWDAHKLSYAYAIIAKALDDAESGRLAKHIINHAETTNGALAPDSVWYRIDSTRDDHLLSPRGPRSIGCDDQDGSGAESDTQDEHDGPGGYTGDVCDNGRATESD